LIIYYISNNCDPKENLIVEEIDGKGKGVVTIKDIHKGSFICEYAGDLIDVKEAKVSTKCKIKKKIMLTV